MMEENVNQKDLDLKTVVLEIEEPDQEPDQAPDQESDQESV